VDDETRNDHPEDNSSVTNPTVAKNATKERKDNARKTIEDVLAVAAKHLETGDDKFLIMAKGYAHELQKMKPLQRLYAAV
jgi:hypothetical protein